MCVGIGCCSSPPGRPVQQMGDPPIKALTPIHCCSPTLTTVCPTTAVPSAYPDAEELVVAVPIQVVVRAIVPHDLQQVALGALVPRPRRVVHDHRQAADVVCCEGGVRQRVKVDSDTGGVRNSRDGVRHTQGGARHSRDGVRHGASSV
jgi:hypothetical protein